MAAFSTFLRFLKWKMDGKWKMENAHRMGHRRYIRKHYGVTREGSLDYQGPHLWLRKNSPKPRAIQPEIGSVVRVQQVGGLHGIFGMLRTRVRTQGRVKFFASWFARSCGTPFPRTSYLEMSIRSAINPLVITEPHTTL